MSEKPKEIKHAESVLSLFQQMDKDCDNKRRFMIPSWKQAEFYWQGWQDLWWDASISNFRTFDSANGDDEFDAIRDYNKIINKYRAYGESIISASTTGNLQIRFIPANADDPQDVDKSNAYSDISSHVQRVNNIKTLRREALRLRWTQGLVAAYTYYKKDGKEFGTYNRNEYANKPTLSVTSSCESCGYEDTKDYENPHEMATEPMLAEENCPQCAQDGMQQPLARTDEISQTPYVSGSVEEEKGCAVIELYGSLSLKVPFYATKPSEIDYIILENEIHYAKARSLFPDYATSINAGSLDRFEADERNQADYYNALPSNELVTIYRFWCKPSMYWALPLEGDKVKELEKEYPTGLFGTFVGAKGSNPLLVRCSDTDMDAHWSFIRSPTDSHVYLYPLGKGMIPIQDMENDLTFLTLDTIRHAVGETFVDSSIIDLKTYSAAQAKPGSLVPVTTSGGKAIGDYFFSTKNATLSREVNSFQQYLDTSGQLVTGALPSIYGGGNVGGGGTLGEYERSRSQALQRITVPADGIDDLLCDTVHKAVKLYDENMAGDETHAVEEGGGFRNVNLRKTVSGRIARADLIKSEQFPTTWEQKRQSVIELLGLNKMPIDSAIFDPVNSSLLARIVAIPDLKIPGDADRNKMLYEIQKLLQGQPIMPPPPMPGQEMMGPDGAPMPPPEPQPSIPPDFDVDNNQVAISTIVSWAVSPEGMRAKVENPQGYANVIAQLHLRKQKLMEDMQQQQPAPEGAPPPQKEQV